MEFRLITPEEAGWTAPKQTYAIEADDPRFVTQNPLDRLIVLKSPQDVTIPEGFELSLFNPAKDRFAEDPVNYSKTDVLRREPDSSPTLPSDDVTELLKVTRRIAVLDSQIDPLKAERDKLAAQAIALAIKSGGNRGAGFEDLGKNVNVAPAFQRRVTDVSRFREETGILFGTLGHEVVNGEISIPPGLRTEDGAQVTGEMIIEGMDTLLIALGIDQADRVKLLRNLKATVKVPSSNWGKIALEIAEGRLSPDTVTAVAKWAVKSIDRSGTSDSGQEEPEDDE